MRVHACLLQSLLASIRFHEWCCIDTPALASSSSTRARLYEPFARTGSCPSTGAGESGLEPDLGFGFTAGAASHVHGAGGSPACAPRMRGFEQLLHTGRTALHFSFLLLTRQLASMTVGSAYHSQSCENGNFKRVGSPALVTCIVPRQHPRYILCRRHCSCSCCRGQGLGCQGLLCHFWPCNVDRLDYADSVGRYEREMEHARQGQWVIRQAPIMFMLW